MADSCSRLVSINMHAGVPQVALGEEHVHVFHAGILKKIAGDATADSSDANCCF